MPITKAHKLMMTLLCRIMASPVPSLHLSDSQHRVHLLRPWLPLVTQFCPSMASTSQLSWEQVRETFKNSDEFPDWNTVVFNKIWKNVNTEIMNRDCEYLTLGVSFFHFRGIPLMYHVIKKTHKQTNTYMEGAHMQTGMWIVWWMTSH